MYSIQTILNVACFHVVSCKNLEELSLSAAVEREDLAQSYMVADKESQEVGKAHIQRFQRSKLWRKTIFGALKSG